MVILGIGNDLVDCRRIERMINKFGKRFLDRVFTLHEQNRMKERAAQAASFAKIFAAKEAALKAIGTGMTQGTNWHQIEVKRHGNVPPYLVLSGAALFHFQKLVPKGMQGNMHLSLSDEWPYASAFVILSATSKTH